MATDIVCPHCRAMLRLSVSDDVVVADLLKVPDPDKTDDDILRDLLTDDDDDDDKKE